MATVYTTLVLIMFPIKVLPEQLNVFPSLPYLISHVDILDHASIFKTQKTCILNLFLPFFLFDIFPCSTYLHWVHHGIPILASSLFHSNAVPGSPIC